MPLPEKRYTSDDYWNLPDGERAELINGQLYMMAPPSRLHQELVHQLSRIIGNYISDKRGDCKIYPAPFAVNLNADDTVYVEPDISVICSKDKLTDKGCVGAPDFIIEIVDPGSRKLDYSIKNGKYAEAGVREYWIVDPEKERTTVYHYDEDSAPVMIPFDQPVTVGKYGDLSFTIASLI